MCFLISTASLYCKGNADENILAENTADVNNREGNFTYVIDPGHGGVDGGAQGITGSVEKDINLKVSLIMRDLFNVLGYSAVMTREEDILLGNNTEGHKKQEDLRERVDFVKKHENAIFISIHMNKFPEEYCRGLTVYYSANDPRSEALGKSVMSATLRYLQPDNKRPMKKATSSLYVLHRATVPAILIECGFLSNKEEEALLLRQDYQKKLALTLVNGIALWSQSQ